MTDAARIAQALTPAQRKALPEFTEADPEDLLVPEWMLLDGRVVSGLHRRGLLGRHDHGDGFPHYTATDLGRAVAAELKEDG